MSWPGTICGQDLPSTCSSSVPDPQLVYNVSYSTDMHCHMQCSLSKEPLELASFPGFLPDLSCNRAPHLRDKMEEAWKRGYPVEEPPE